MFSNTLFRKTVFFRIPENKVKQMAESMAKNQAIQ